MRAEDLPPRYAGYENKIPRDLADLRGPSSGVIGPMPNRLVWSGQNMFDLDDWREALMFYGILLHVGQRADFEEYMHPALLRGLWPKLRQANTSEITRRWEAHLPGLV